MQVIPLLHIDSSLTLYCITVYQIKHSYTKVLLQSDIPTIVASKKPVMLHRYDDFLTIYPFSDLEEEIYNFASHMSLLISGKLKFSEKNSKTIVEEVKASTEEKKIEIENSKSSLIVADFKHPIIINIEAEPIRNTKTSNQNIRERRIKKSQKLQPLTNNSINHPSLILNNYNNNTFISNIDAKHSERQNKQFVMKYLTQRIKPQPQNIGGISSFLSKVDRWSNNSKQNAAYSINKLTEKESFVNHSEVKDTLHNIKEIEYDSSKKLMSNIKLTDEKCVFPL